MQAQESALVVSQPTASTVDELAASALAEGRLGNFERGASLLEELVSLQPNRQDAWALLGKFYLLAQQFGKAEAALGRAFELGESSPPVEATQADVMLDLASVAWESNRVEEAERWLRLAGKNSVQIPDLRAQALRQLASLLLWRGESAAALDLLLGLLDSDRGPSDVDRGVPGPLLAGDTTLAVEFLDQLPLDLLLTLARARLEVAQASPEGNGLSSSAERSKQLVQCRSEFEAFLRRAPNHSEAQYSLARVLRLQEDPAAEKAMKRARDLFDQDHELARNETQTQARLDQLEAELNETPSEGLQTMAELVGRTLEQQPRTAGALRLRGLVALRLGETSKARELVSEALILDSERSDLRVLLRQIDEQANDLAPSRKKGRER